MAEKSPIDVQKALKGAHYPTDRDTLVRVAQENNADKELLETFSHMRRNRFDGPNDVEKEVFGD
jgi:hypothetical protein